MLDKILELIKTIEDLDSEDTSIFIQGGYFDCHIGVDEFSKNTLMSSILLSNKISDNYGKVNIYNGILVNDFGQMCSDTVCVPTSGKIFSQEHILAEVFKLKKNIGIEGIFLSISTEKHMKNIGLRKLKKIIKRGEPNRNLLYFSEESENKQWYLSAETDILLFIEKKDSWIAKCPVIMGGYYFNILKEMKKKDHQNGINVVIDFCAINDKTKVLKGAEVTLRLFEDDSGNGKNFIMPVLANESCSYISPLLISKEDFEP